MKCRPKKPGWYDVYNTDNFSYLGSFLVEHTSAGGLLCKGLKYGGSIHCTGFKDWSDNGVYWLKI